MDEEVIRGVGVGRESHVLACSGSGRATKTNLHRKNRVPEAADPFRANAGSGIPLTPLLGLFWHNQGQRIIFHGIIVHTVYTIR